MTVNDDSVKKLEKVEAPGVIGVPEATSAKKPKEGCFGDCCATVAGLIVFSVVASFGIYFLVQYFEKQDSKSSKEPKTVYFLSTQIPNYEITENERALFDQKIKGKFSDEDSKKMIGIAQKAKDIYPEGYFVIIKSTLKYNDSLNIWPLFINLYSDNVQIDVAVHELSHITLLLDSSYWIEDKSLTIPGYGELDSKLFDGLPLLKYIESPTSFDEKYLKESKQRFTLTLDEINSYTKSVKIARIQNEYNSNSENLARQLYILTLHLKHAKEVETDDWKLLTNNKSLAFTVMRLVTMAEVELENAKSSGIEGSGTAANLKLFEENRHYFDEYLQASGVKDLNSENLTLSDLQKLGVDLNFKKF